MKKTNYILEFILFFIIIVISLHLFCSKITEKRTTGYDRIELVDIQPGDRVIKCLDGIYRNVHK